MAGSDEEPALTVPKFSSFKSKELQSSKTRDEELPSPLVPKFGSSKLKDTAPSAKGERRHHDDRDRRRRGGERPDDGSRGDDDRWDDKKRRHRSERGRDHDSKRRRHDDHEHREKGERRKRRSRSPRERSKPSVKPPAPDPQTVKSDRFFFDTKGDPLITRYGSERSLLPRYRRYGGGRVLGTEGRLVIHRDRPREEFSLRMPGEGSGLSRAGLGVRKSYLKREGVHIGPHKVDADKQLEGDDGFLRLGKLESHDVNSDVSSDETNKRPDYRSIEGKAKAKQIDSESSGDSSSEDDIPLDEKDPLKWRSIQLSRRTKDDPKDIDAWIELVDHQDALLRAGQTVDAQVVEDEVHSFKEIKVSILERALLHTTNKEDRSRVLNYLMREGPNVWSSKTTAKRWEQLQTDEERDFSLWRTHLNFAMSNIATFSHDGVKAMLVGRLNYALIPSKSSSHPCHDFFEAIYVFLRLTRFLHDAGFKELAVAAWQALLELMYFRPDGFDERGIAMKSLSEFWESEVPRIGEPNSKGWSRFVETGGEPPEPLENTKQPNTSKRTCQSWADCESVETTKSLLPSRTMDEGNDDDPYRVVMFSDIEPYLFLIPREVMPLIQSFLLDAYLMFCGLPPSNRADEWTGTAWQDPFLTGPCKTELSNGAWENRNEETGLRPPALRGYDFNAACELDVLFPGDAWFDILNRDRLSAYAERNWIKLTLQELVLSAGFESLAPYYLSLSTGDPTPKSLAKRGKAILKRYPNNPLLYRAYALAEYAQGNVATAMKVLQSATTIFPLPLRQHGVAATADGLQLWVTWAWIELQISTKAVALKRLCSAFDERLRDRTDDVAATSLSVSLAHDGIHRNDSDGIPGYLVTRDKAYVLLEYLRDGEPCEEPTSASQGNICTAMGHIWRMHDHYRAELGKANDGHEELLQFAAHLLYFHTTRGPFRRKFIRKSLLDFLKFFPRNTIFLSLLEWSDSSLRVIDETRTFLHDNTLIKPRDCLTSRIFAIHHELRHGNVHTTRTAFENALAGEACRSSPHVWISYIRFCRGQREIRGQVKNVFYRALRYCPWAKEVMMEAFALDGMFERELRSVHGTMEEKGMRIHVDMERYLKGT